MGDTSVTSTTSKTSTTSSTLLRLRGVDWLTLIAHHGLVTVDWICGVGHSLDPTIRQVNLVTPRHGSHLVLSLRLGEGGLAVVVLDPVLIFIRLGIKLLLLLLLLRVGGLDIIRSGWLRPGGV